MKNKFIRQAKLPKAAYPEKSIEEALAPYRKKLIKEKQKLIDYLENGGIVEDLPKTKNISEKPF